MFKLKVIVKTKKLPVLTLTRIPTSKAKDAIDIPDTYLNAIENARKAEKRALHRLAAWVRDSHPGFYSEHKLHEFLEDE